jgi:hypothetical protein
LKKDNVVDIHFPTDGMILHWKTKDILYYLFEYKKYRKSPKNISKRQYNRVLTIENNEGDLVVVVAPRIMEVPRAMEIPIATKV